MAAPALIHRFDIRVNLAAPIELGQTPHGLKRIVPVAGGVVDGPYMRGDVLPGGADWQTVRADGITEIDVRCTLCTHDGVLIAVYSQGYRHAPPEIIQKILKGEAVPDDSYYFRTAPRFELVGDRYPQLSRAMFIGVGLRRPDHVALHVYEVA